MSEPSGTWPGIDGSRRPAASNACAIASAFISSTSIRPSSSALRKRGARPNRSRLEKQKTALRTIAGLQQELERQPSTPADVREIARAAAYHRIDQRERDAGEQRAADPDALRQA